MVASLFTSERLRRASLALSCFAVLIFFFSPAWSAFWRWSQIPEMGFQVEVRRGISVLEQVDHPGGAISDPLHRAIQWRLLFPLIGRALHLPPAMLFSLAHLGCVMVLGFIVSALRKAGIGWGHVGISTLILGAASWFFTSTGWLGYYDSWLALALLLIGFATSPRTVWLTCIWAPWVDERFVIAAPLALLCRFIQSTKDGNPAQPLRRLFGVPAALIALFLIIRLGVLASYSSEGATLGSYFAGNRFLDAPFSRLAYGAWEGLRAGWFFVVIALWLIRGPAGLAVSLATLATLVVGLATAQDYSRSMTMLLPVAVLGALYATRLSANGELRFYGVAAVLALTLPAHHVMNDRVDSIYYLHHEVAAFEHPPRAAMPEFYELSAVHAMERGEFPSAENYLTLAMKLAANPAAPAKQRGILRASQQRWTEAEQDFALLVKSDPKNPEAWFMHAQAELALGRPVNARSDLERARTLAKPEWISRPDVARFVAKLNAR